MRIIRHGKVPHEEVYLSICGYCETSFEFYEYEANVKRSDKTQWVEVLCPHCRRVVKEDKK